MNPFFSAEQFGRLSALLRQERQIHTKQRETIRRFLAAAFWMSRSGAQWRFLRPTTGNGAASTSASRAGMIWASGNGCARGVAEDPDLQRVMIDATVVRAHACAGGAPHKTAGRRHRGSGARAAASARRSMCSWTLSATR